MGVNSGTAAEAERIWQDTTEEEDNNRSIITRAASHVRMETGSRTGSTLNDNREVGGVEFCWKEIICIKSE